MEFINKTQQTKKKVLLLILKRFFFNSQKMFRQQCHKLYAKSLLMKLSVNGISILHITMQDDNENWENHHIDVIGMWEEVSLATMSLENLAKTGLTRQQCVTLLNVHLKFN